MSTTGTQSPTDPELTYHFGAAPRRKSLSWRRAYPEPLPEPAQGLVFHIFHSRDVSSRKAYKITLADRKTEAFHVTFPYTAFGLSSRPNILVQRGGSSGPVIGEVRYHSWNTDEIVLPLISSSSVAKLTTDGFFKRGRRIRFEGREWLWRHVSSRAESGPDAVGESAVDGRWKCTDAKGTIYGLVSRTASPDKVGRIAVTRDHLEDQTIEALVVCAVAMLEKEQKRGSVSSSDGD